MEDWIDADGENQEGDAFALSAKPGIFDKALQFR
jgi:hypothetical protein